MANKVGIFKPGKGLYGGLNTQVAKEDIYIMDGGGNSLASASDSALVTGIISGNGVAWIENFDYEVTPYVFNINNKQYTTARRLITLENPDPTDDRIDVVIATYNAAGKGTIEVLTGTPAPSPVKPVLTSYQLEITTINVTANTIESDVNSIIVFDENVEFTGSDNTSGRVAYDSVEKFFTGAKSIKLTGFKANDEVSLSGANFDPNDYNVLQFLISAEARWDFNGEIEVSIYNGTERVSDWVKIDGDPYNTKGNDIFFQSGNSAWQAIVVPMFKLIPTSTVANKIVFRKISLGVDTFFLDTIRLQQGVSAQNTVTDSTNFVDYGEFTVYRAKGNPVVKNLQIGDMVTGWFSPTKYFRLAKYLGGSINVIGSFDVIDGVTNP